MKFFVDTADVKEIRELNSFGLLDGVTTNPSLILKSGGNIADVTREICDIVEGPVSAEVVATEFPQMMREAQVLAKIAKNVCIKVPLTLDGLKACRAIRNDLGRMVNVTLCFSANQALLAAKAGATLSRPSSAASTTPPTAWNSSTRSRKIYTTTIFRPRCSPRPCAPAEPREGGRVIGAHVVTAPPATLKPLVKHPLTDQGLEAFLADWAKTGQKIG